MGASTPVIDTVDTASGIEEAIRTRLRNGFSNWNLGYEAWLEWCDTLYEPDAHYNVSGHRMTLQQYKDSMRDLFGVFEIELGDFFNMLVEGPWCAIRYSVRITDKRSGESFEQMTMEFVNFRDNPAPVGVRVVEGWALSDRPISA